MQINSINRTQTNINHKANFDIVGDRALMTSEQLRILKTKAQKLGTAEDYIMIGITKIDPITVPNIKPIIYEIEKIKQTADTYTKITAACHTFFDIHKPDSFIKSVADIHGSRIERANKSFDIINSYLDNIDAGLKE